MKIYIIIGHWTGGLFEIIKVVSSEKEAKEIAKKLERNNFYLGISIKEAIVGDKMKEQISNILRESLAKELYYWYDIDINREGEDSRSAYNAFVDDVITDIECNLD